MLHDPQTRPPMSCKHAPQPRFPPSSFAPHPLLRGADLAPESHFGTQLRQAGTGTAADHPLRLEGGETPRRV